MKFFWKTASSGDFATSADWTPSGPPDALGQAMLTATGGPYTVTVSQNETVLNVSTSANATLELSEPGIVFTAEQGTGSGANNGTIKVDNNTIFAIAGRINNNGTIELLATGGAASLFLLGDTTLNGGALTLSDTSGANYIDGGGTLTNAGNSDISGAGFIEVAVNNKATVLPSGNIIPLIDGNSDSHTLTLDGPLTNTGELRGEGAAGLVIGNIVYNTGGLIDANGGAVFVEGGTIIGGTIENSGGTFLVAEGGLDGGGTHPITMNGQISVQPSQIVATQGAFKTNNGILALQGSSSLLLGLDNAPAVDTTFSGGGQIFMTSAAIDLNSSTHVGSIPLKLNNVDDIIIGTGTIGNASTPGSFVLNNEAKGIVEALNGNLSIYSSVTNAGVLDATNGTLNLIDNVITNTGSLKAEAGAIISLQNTTIHGGTLTGDGTFDADNAVLDGSTAALTNAGNITMSTVFVSEVRTLTLKGTINNNGAIELLPYSGSGGTGPSIGSPPIGSDLVIGPSATSSQVTLKGSGSVFLEGAYGQDAIIGDADLPGGVPTTLDNLSNIVGVGRIGDGGLTLKNGGTIAAGEFGPSAALLVIDTGDRTVTNTGTLRSNFASDLDIDSPLNNTGGKLDLNRGEIIAARGATGGTASIFDGTLEFGGPTTTNVQFNDPSFYSSGLVLDDSVHFKGTISGFDKVSTSETIDLLDIDSATAHKVSYASGVLTIKDGLGHTAQLHFSGAYTLASFNLNPDGHGGTLLTDPPVAPPANPTLFGHHMAAAFPEAFGSHLTKFETAAHPLLALPHG